LVVVSVLTLSSTAFAFNANGVFKTSGGNTFDIHVLGNGHNGHLRIHAKGANGAFDGIWDNPGHTFHYADHGEITRGVLKNDNLIEMHFANGTKSAWVRVK
jgi:hypothetical protein